ncbi:MAG: hypothetical protein A3F70_12710 [Acidobacteria bacterium RIFCSPLOWO2_12_FULL_67_14]|nr:MAG: hypothetical protein A3F70_12710 [Acidobacteria bacterium RIFCSPLOWO2_12_FULL_67_14]
MRLATAAVVYAAVTALLFRDLLPDLRTHLYSDLGDPLLNAAILAWNARQLPLTEAWWNFPSYAPLAGVTAFTEHLLGAYPLATPIVWLTGSPILAYNAIFLLAMPLNGAAAFALARELLAERGAGDTAPAAAFLAGLAFAFAPYQAVQLSHVQHMTAFGMPVALLWLHRYLRTGRRRALVWFGAGWLITVGASSSLLVFFPLLAAIWSLWFVRPRDWTRLAGAALAAALATLPLVPLLWGYHVRQAAHGLARSYAEIQSFSADVAGLFGMYHRSAAWRGVLPHDFEEGALFAGFTTYALGLLGVVSVARAMAPHRAGVRGGDPAGGARGEPGRLAPQLRVWSTRFLLAFLVITLIVLARVWTGPWGWHIGPLPLPPFRPYRLFTVAFVLLIAGGLSSEAFRRAWSRRDTVIFCAVAAALMWLVALGPEPEWSTPWRALVYGPYRLLLEIPGAQSIRVPARAWLPALLCVTLLAAFGASALLKGAARRFRTVAAAVLALAIVAEGWTIDATVEAPAPMRSGTIARGALVLDLPIEEGFQGAVPQYRGVMGGYRTINGYSGYEPPHYYPLRRAIADLHPDAFDAYLRVEDLYVIVRPGLDPLVARSVATHPRATHLFDVDDARVYRLSQLH